jgi:transcriptional regulator with XRE-family HTH domain
MAFGDLLKVIRGQKGLSQDGLAKAAGLSTSAVSKLEQNLVEPSWPTVRALCRALGVPCTAFDVDEGAQTPPEPQCAPGRPRQGQEQAQEQPAPKKARKKT